MQLLDKRDLERTAAALVVDELGAVGFEERDKRGAPAGTRDFDIVFADGHEEPLEITSNFDTITMSALQRTDGGILELEASVTRLWMVTGNHTHTDAKGDTVPFDRRRISQLLPALIEQLEREGETALDVVALAWPIASGAPNHHQAVALELHTLGITHGGSVEIPASGEGSDSTPGISVHLGGGGSWGPETITTVLEDIAKLDDNVKKLEARRDATRRHLFVVLSGRGSTDMAGWALDQYVDGDWIWERELPLPKLPEAITTIWAGNRHGGIYATPPGDWQRFGSAKERAPT